MRTAVLPVQLLDGFATTALSVRGELPSVLAGAGLRDVTVAERMRTLIGTFEVVTANR
jgi:hypothetical protein